MKLEPQEITFRRSRNKSILLVANDDQIVSQLSDAVGRIPNHDFDAQTGTLSGLNGRAVELARSNDLIMFETSGDRRNDLDAMSALRDELDQNVKIIAVTKEDISLSTARQITRAGADEVFTYPFDAEELRDQVERLTSPNPLVVVQQPAVADSAPGTVIAVGKATGGIGATTVAVNLANLLQGKSGIRKRRASKRVVLLDLDLQFGAVSAFLDVDPSDCLYRLAEDGSVPDSRYLDQSIVTAKCGIDVLTAPARFAPLGSLSAEQIGTMIELLQVEYDYVVIDLPQALVDWLSPVLEKTDRFLMVTDCTVPSIRQARRLIDFYTNDNVGMPIDILVNHEKKPVIKGGVYKEAENVLERPLRYWLPTDRRIARAAVDRGEPLHQVSGRSPLSRAFGQMAKALAEDIEAKRQSKAQSLPQGKAN